MATLNGILKDHRSQWPGGLTEHQYSTLNLIAHCRSGVLGSIAECCQKCGHSQVLPQSCGNRHCPLCQGVRAAEWSDRVCSRLPAVPHFHVVFTVPQGLAQVMRDNFKVLGDVFFASVNQTLRTFFTNNLACEGGYMAVMHTWGSNLCWHPHIHTIVCGGGYRLEGGQWVGFSPNYLFPVRALSKVFRAIFLRELQEADARGALTWSDELSDPLVRCQWRRGLAARDWVVYAEPTLKRTRALVRYLARYTSHTAISNSRILEIDPVEKTVKFTCKDYRNNGEKKIVQLSMRSFIGRFAQHIAPKGFRRIRYYGFLTRRRAAANTPNDVSERPCPRCRATRWTRRRICASLCSIPHEHHLGKYSERTTPSASSSKRGSFSLLSGCDPPLTAPIQVQQVNAGVAGKVICSNRRFVRRP